MPNIVSSTYLPSISFRIVVFYRRLQASVDKSLIILSSIPAPVASKQCFQSINY